MGSLSLVLLRIDPSKFLESTPTKRLFLGYFGYFGSLIYSRWTESLTMVMCHFFLHFQTSKQHIYGNYKGDGSTFDLSLG